MVFIFYLLHQSGTGNWDILRFRRAFSSNSFISAVFPGIRLIRAEIVFLLLLVIYLPCSGLAVQGGAVIAFKAHDRYFYDLPGIIIYLDDFYTGGTENQ